MCGHPRRSHVDGKLSVPIRSPKPVVVEVVTGFYGHIAKMDPKATLDVQQCWCGCTIWEELA